MSYTEEDIETSFQHGMRHAKAIVRNLLDTMPKELRYRGHREALERALEAIENNA